MAVIKWTAASNLAIGKRLAAARDAKGLSTAALAELLGVSKGTVNHWELGNRAIKHDDLARLCQALDLSADEALFGVRRWPFKGIDFDLVNDLDPRDLGRLEGSLMQLAQDFGMQIKRESNGT